MRVAVIGSGLAGLAAAGSLQEAGLSPIVYDKGRGLGGRLATRRTPGGLQFDHGAQYISPRDKAFASFLNQARHAGAAGIWKMAPGEEKTVGRPGMNAIAKFAARGLDVRQGVEVTSIQASRKGWAVAGDHFDRVICTVPAPQAARLIGAAHPICEALHGVVMEPCLTLMLALPQRPYDVHVRRDPNDDIGWLALDSAKHARPGPACWVAQAGVAWSKAHLELGKDAIADAMVPLVCEMLDADPSQAIYVAAHRWRYARTTTPLGQPYLSDDSTLFLGGDWALANRAEAAWQSGIAMARALLASR